MMKHRWRRVRWLLGVLLGLTLASLGLVVIQDSISLCFDG
jgi:hypothetical protein